MLPVLRPKTSVGILFYTVVDYKILDCRLIQVKVIRLQQILYPQFSINLSMTCLYLFTVRSFLSLLDISISKKSNLGTCLSFSLKITPCKLSVPTTSSMSNTLFEFLHLEVWLSFGHQTTTTSTEYTVNILNVKSIAVHFDPESNLKF